MDMDDWPTHSEMILTRKGVGNFIDYNATQTVMFHMLDESSQIWETPFSPTNRSFPYTQQHPHGLSVENAHSRMYMANHNLDTELALAGFSLLVAITVLLNVTNNVSGYGSLGATAEYCTENWPISYSYDGAP